MGANITGAGILCPKTVATTEHQPARPARRDTATEHTRQVAHVGVDEGAGDDAPAVERLPVRALRPAQARVRVRVEVPAVAQLLLRRLLQLLRVDGERRYCVGQRRQ